MRIVEIPGADVCACCGTHVARSGQVGQIKILASEHYKGGERLSVVCGRRALDAAVQMRAAQADIGALLSAKPTETALAVHRLAEAHAALQYAHHGLCGQLLMRWPQPPSPGRPPSTPAGLDPDGLHRLAVRLTQATDGLCAALAPHRKGTGYCLALASGGCAPPDTGAECGAERPGRRQARHLSGQLRRQPGTGVTPLSASIWRTEPPFFITPKPTKVPIP